MVKITCLNDNKISAVSRENSVYLPGGTILKERYKIVDVIGVGGFGITYKAIYGKFSFNRELMAEEESNAFHGGDLYQLVDGSYEMVVYDEYNWSEYSDLDGNFYFNFDDNMPSGIYKFEVSEDVGECWCTYEIVFELH